MKEQEKSGNRWLRLLEWFCPDSLHEGIEGDLREQYETDLELFGPHRAKLRLALGVIKFFRPGILLRNKYSISLINTLMMRNYFLTASRSIKKRPLYAFINAFGLSVAIASCGLIYLYIGDEHSFDQFHENKHEIYRIHARLFEKGDANPYELEAYLPPRLGDVMLEEAQEVQYMTRMVGGQRGIMKYGDKVFNQSYTLVDSGFFKMFSFEIVAGDRSGLLGDPGEAVLTEEVAQKFFGNEDPIGKVFTLGIDGEKAMRVAAVIKAPPANSSIVFNMLIPIQASSHFSEVSDQWGNFSFPTFVMLQTGSDPASLKANLDRLMEKHMGASMKRWREEDQLPPDFKVCELYAMPLTEIHLEKEISWDRVSDPQYSWILGGIAVMILIVASINYISLAISTSVSRRIEVGIRKSIGARRRQLVAQFGFESILLAGISMVVGLILIVTFLPSFNDFTGKGIELHQNDFPIFIGILFGISAIVGILAGSYPAVFLSRFVPAQVLKGKGQLNIRTGFSTILVVLQFFLSASMIISSVIMNRQMEFVATKDLGYDREQVIAVSVPYGNHRSKSSLDLFRNMLAMEPSVVSVAGTSSPVVEGWSRFGYNIKDEKKLSYVFSVDPQFVPLLGLELAIGRNFDERIPSDSMALIVNEALVRDMKWTDPLTEHLNWQEDTVGQGYHIIGVLKDYHFSSLENKIQPMFLTKNGPCWFMLVKLSPGETPSKIELVKNAWSLTFPGKPFEFEFIDEQVNNLYRSHERWMSIMRLSTILAILIACLGLFGLAGINAMNRTKEIGIRKVMGADLAGIFLLLNRRYVWMAMVAFVLAAPVSWYAMEKWLSGFQYRIQASWEVFVVSMALGLVIALATVTYHGIKAALINPAETLKYE